MTIQYLVLSGGGTVGINYMGILQHLEEQHFLKIDNIKSIYSTSAGVLVAIMLCLRYDWDTLSTYLIDRPWQDVFTITGKQIFEAYYKKGVYDKKIIDIIFKPLLEAKDLSLNITLQEFYEYSKIELFFYSFELNSFKTVEISHTSHPELPLLTAAHMSCAIPGLFMPVITNNNCYIDGGFIDNYPLNYCLQRNIPSDEILGLNYIIFTNTLMNERSINNDSTMLDFILDFSIKSMHHIANSVTTQSIPYEIVYKFDESPVSFNFTTKVIQSKDLRKSLYEDGIKYAKEFLSKIESENK